MPAGGASTAGTDTPPVVEPTPPVDIKPEDKPVEPTPPQPDPAHSDVVTEQQLKDMSPDEAAQEVEQVMNLISMNPALKDDPQIKGFLDIADKVMKAPKDAPESPVVDTKPEDQATKPPVPGDATQPIDTKPEDQKPNDAPKRDPNDAFGTGANSQQPQVDLKVEKLEDVTNYVKTQYSIDELPAFFTSANQWRKDSEQQADTQTKLDDLNEGIASLPDGIKSAIDAFANGQNWYQAIEDAGARLNMDVPFENQPKMDVVRTYFPDKIKSLEGKVGKAEDAGGITQDAFDIEINDLHNTSKRLYTNDKTQWDAQRAGILDDEAKQDLAFSASATSSVDALVKEFPNFDKNQLQSVRDRLVRGDFVSLLFKEDGTYRDDAAKRLALALYGDKQISLQVQKAIKEGETKANEENIDRGNQTVVTKKAQEQQQNAQQNAAVTHLSEELNQVSPYGSKKEFLQ